MQNHIPENGTIKSVNELNGQELHDFKMAVGKTQYDLNFAREKAEMLLELFSPLCQKIEIAGSIRRQKTTVSDIELVCVPYIAKTGIPTLFGNNGVQITTPLFQFLESSAQFFPFIKNGDKYKQFLFQGIKVDLFITTKEDYYRQLAIRTGSADYSHKVIATAWVKLGWVGTAQGLRKRADCICTGKNQWEVKSKNPTIPQWESEQDFFQSLGLSYLHPSQRIVE